MRSPVAATLGGIIGHKATCHCVAHTLAPLGTTYAIHRAKKKPPRSTQLPGGIVEGRDYMAAVGGSALVRVPSEKLSGRPT
jgi:hypothetical protein